MADIKSNIQIPQISQNHIKYSVENIGYLIT